MEGYREITRAVQSDSETGRISKILPRIKLEILCISPECFLGENEWDLIESLGIPVWEFPKQVFEKISYRDRPDGLIAIGSLPDYHWNPCLLDQCKNGLVLVIEGVEKPGNLGTIIRTADGAGVELLVVTDPRTDIYNPNVIRSSTGVLFQLPVYSGDTKTVFSDLKQAGYSILSLTPEAKKPYYSADLKKKSALVFGSEQYGLSDAAKLDSDELLSIPMSGAADSLNLALSTGIVLYELLRQRKA